MCVIPLVYLCQRVCEPLLLLWVRLGGSSPGSFALIRAAMGQFSITPSMTKILHEKCVSVCERKSQLVGTAHSLQPEHTVGLEAWKLELCVWPSKHFLNYFSQSTMNYYPFWSAYNKGVNISITISHVNSQAQILSLLCNQWIITVLEGAKLLGRVQDEGWVCHDGRRATFKGGAEMLHSMYLS